MARRLISSTKSEIRQMTAMELKSSIRASEGRVILAQNYVGHEPLVQGTTNPELSEAMGADMVFFNGYPMDPESKIPAFEVDIFEKDDYINKHFRLKDIKKLLSGPVGIYLECGSGDDVETSTNASFQLVRPERMASKENLKKLIEEEADFVVLAGNPGTGTTIEAIIEATHQAKEILGDQVLIFAGKWEDGVKQKVLGDPTAKRKGIDIAKDLLDAGADVICLPMPGSRTGISVRHIQEIVEFVHTYKEGSLCMSFLDGSVEGSDTETVRLCTMMSKETGADIHAIGDAGLCGMSIPEDIYQMAITTKGRRLTWRKLASGHR